MEETPITSMIPEASILRPLGDLTIFEAAQFHADLLALHQQEGPLHIDLREVTCMDSSCVQLMVAATRSGRVTVQGYSSRIRDKFEQIGFAQFLPTQES
ncbi:MAG: hypothetical protein CO149_01890 [Nitrospirae bacterium CG_4_9_14_3_um_filter_51_5]|nr:MAG: hypothetical protein CO149_01890 [Nitrospirae bacterium CG_4_9_14_3_um_filter_51_5]